MKRTFSAVLKALVFLIAVPAVLWAHGEDKPGPHGGVIRMPGALHTEVVALDERSIAVYLLDINFKEPTTADSSVIASINNQGVERTLSCNGSGERFVCMLPKDAALLTGTLFVTAKRRGAQGIKINYTLPLRTPGEAHKQKERTNDYKTTK